MEQFQRRFYPASFVERMEVSLNSYKQGKMSMSEYEAGFNNLIRFVPAVATNEAEKAKRFRRGLRQEFRQVLGALELHDFSSLVEQARGMELEMQLGEEMKGMGCTVAPTDAGGSQKRNFGGGSGSSLKPVSKKFKGSQNSFKSKYTKPQSSNTSRPLASAPMLRLVPGKYDMLQVR